MRRSYLGGLAFLLGAVSCDQVFGIDLAKTGWTGRTGEGTDGGATGGGKLCTPGDTEPCYTGPPGTEGVSVCRGGIAACVEPGAWGTCMGEVTPQPRSCASTTDVACLGTDNCVQWAEMFGNLQGSYPQGVAVDASGDSYVVGSFSGLIQLPNQVLTAKGTTDVFVLKLDSSGVPLWGASFGATGASSTALAVAVDALGEVAIGGFASASIEFGSSSAGPGIYAAKLTATTGDVVWATGLTANYNSQALNAIFSVALTSSGDVVVGGHAGSALNFGDGVIAGPGSTSVYYGFIGLLHGADGSGSVNENGWGRFVCSGTASCDVNSVAVLPSNGNILVSGSFQNNLTLASGPGVTRDAEGTQDAFVASLTSGGSLVWQRQIGASGATATGKYLAVDGDGGPILAGGFHGGIQFDINVNEPPSAGGGFVVHYTSDNGYAWNTVLSQTVEGVAADTKGNVFVAGQFTGSLDLGLGGSSAPLMSVGSSNLFVAKIDSNQALVWAKQYGDGTSVPNATGVAVTPQGDVLIVGDTQATTTFGTMSLTPAGQENVFVVKLSQ